MPTGIALRHTIPQLQWIMSTTTMGTLANPFTMSSFSIEKHVYMGLFDVEKWYESIQNFTFATSFIPLTKSEASTMNMHYKVHQLDHDAALWTQEHKTILANAISKLGSQMANNASSFVRLSTRSPKDAGLLDDSQFQDMVHKELIHLMEQYPNFNLFYAAHKPDPNEKLMAVFSMSSKQLEVKTAEQAMSLLLDSERIYTDLHHALEKDESNWDMLFIVREFVPLDVSYEFRAFACNNVLNAISQYNNLCYYPHLRGKEQEIVDRLVTFYNSISHDIKYTAYVIDFVIIGDVIKVVELNPFGPMTGASLFNWDYDRLIVQGGVDLFGDSFGKKNDISGEHDTGNDEKSSASTAENIDPHNTCFKEYQSSYVYPNNWRTVLRVNERNPAFVNEEYVDAMFSGVFGKKPTATPKQQPQTSENTEKKCIIS